MEGGEGGEGRAAGGLLVGCWWAAGGLQVGCRRAAGGLLLGCWCATGGPEWGCWLQVGCWWAAWGLQRGWRWAAGVLQVGRRLAAGGLQMGGARRRCTTTARGNVQKLWKNAENNKRKRARALPPWLFFVCCFDIFPMFFDMSARGRRASPSCIAHRQPTCSPVVFATQGVGSATQVVGLLLRVWGWLLGVRGLLLRV